MRDEPAKLKAYLVANLGWDAPLLETLVHATTDAWFQLAVYASELRRGQLAPLFQNWIPKDCTARITDGYELAELCIPGVVSICYTTNASLSKPYSFYVAREVRYLGQDRPRAGNLYICPQDWIVEFKNDVMAHYAVEKTLSLVDPTERYRDSYPIAEAGISLDCAVRRCGAKLGPVLGVRARFDGRWTHLWMELASYDSHYSARDFQFPYRSEKWGLSKDAGPEPPDSSGLDPLLLHKYIAEEFESLRGLYAKAKTRLRDRSPTRT